MHAQILSPSLSAVRLPRYCKPLWPPPPKTHLADELIRLICHSLMELRPAPTLPADGYGLTRTYASSTR